MTNIRVASWNILNDTFSRSHGPQSDRLPEIISNINEIKDNSPDKLALFLCECSSLDNIKKIAKQTDLEVVGAERYAIDSPNNEYVSFLTDIELKDRSDATITEFDKGLSRSFAFHMTAAGINFVGTHMPWKMTPKDSIKRKNTAQKIVECLEGKDPSIILGDLNSTNFFPTRRLISKSGYIQAHQTNEPIFPTPAYRKNGHIPWYIPDVSIDTIYFRGKGITVNETGNVVTSVSDHPLIWADLEIK